MIKQRYAILIGNGAFPENSKLETLSCPSKDVEGLANVLVNRGGYQITSLIDQPKSVIECQLADFMRKLTKDDLALIYFSGHGKLSEVQRELYLVTKDTKVDSLLATAIAISQLKSFINESYCGRIIVILDCCHSGAVSDVFVNNWRVKSSAGSNRMNYSAKLKKS